MIDHGEIRQSIRLILLAIDNEDLPSNRSWENRNFKPPENDTWIRETMIPGEERQAASDTIRSVGIMQYDIFWPIGTGTENIEALVDDIKDAFKPVTALGLNSLIYRAERLAAIVDDKWYQIPIRLTWKAHSIG